MDDDYTARAAIRQPAPAGFPASCWVVAHRRLAGVDDDYTARAAIRQPAPAGFPACCGVVAHRRLAGVDDVTTTTLHGPSSGSRLRPAAWLASLSHERPELVLSRWV